jgi:diguanylate cyclase (GGDEF)-like protein/PAS domain S-box-containing protein
MCVCLFIVSRGHLTDVNGIRHWATALLLQCISWILLALIEIIPKFFSIVVGVIALFLGLVFYVHGLALFKERHIAMHWLYLIIAMGVVGNIYFVFINFNTAAKIAVTSTTIAILLLTSSFLLFSKQQNTRSISHCLTGIIFTFAAFVTLARAYYYLFLNTQANQSLFNINIIQDLFYLTNTLLLIGASFCFILMCNEKYLAERKQIEQRLKESETLFRAVFDNAAIGIAQLALTGMYLQVNQEYCHLLGYTKEEFLSLGSQNITYVGDILADMDNINKLLVGINSRYSMEKRYIHKNGSLVWANLSVQLLRDGDGQPLFFINAIREITERKRMEQHLRDGEQKFRSVIKKMPLALGLTNERDELIFINDRFQSTFGYTLDDLPTIEHWWPLAYPDEKYRQQVIATWTTAVENAARLGADIEPLEYRITCKDGIERVMLVSGIGFAEGHIYTYIDVTERKAAEEEIQQLAFFDPLTGLPNRRKLLDRLQYAIALNHRNQSQFAVFMMDLDKFKAVNDKLGHAAGDELLKQVALRITNCLRDSDMVARLGGDEFVLVLENLKVLEDAETVALKVIEALTVTFQLSENNTVQIGASIGISLYPQHGSTPEILMDHADTALYQAKDNGRGCFAYFAEASCENKMSGIIKSGQSRI